MTDGRFLHKHSQYGYTESTFNAVQGEGEAVPPSYQQELTAKAHARRAEERSEEIERENARSALGQIRRLQDQVRKQGKDPNPVLLETKRKLEDLAA